MRRTLLLGFALLIPMLAFGSAATNIGARGTDDEPCGDPYWHNGHQRYVQKCPLWRGHVPVMGADGSQVGELVAGGSANWFECQAVGETYRLGNYANDWYAYTLADNGEWGWVPEVFFSGGENFEPDAGLARCDW